MALIVQKFGGSSVEDPDKILNVAKKVLYTINQGHQVVVVVSAMGDTTDYLMELAEKITPNYHPRDLDSLLATGEMISVAALAMAINDLKKSFDYYSIPFTAYQTGIYTDKNYGTAKITDISSQNLKNALKNNIVPVIAGFQGINKEDASITTLGRGGSDLTAVAVASAIGADVCEIYTDVDGIFTADPRIVPLASKFDAIRFDSLVELAASGAKVIAPRSVEFARRNKVLVHIRSSFNHKIGTLITENGKINPKKIIPNYNRKEIMEDFNLHENALLFGIAVDDKLAKITLYGVEDKPGISALLYGELAKNNINIDLIVQNVSQASLPAKCKKSTKTKFTDTSFTVKTDDLDKTKKLIDKIKSKLTFNNLEIDDQVAKVSLVGASIKNTPGIFAKAFEALANAKINIEMITTSEIRLTIVVKKSDTKKAVQQLHTAFGLDSKRGKAKVYAGSGR